MCYRTKIQIFSSTKHTLNMPNKIIIFEHLATFHKRKKYNYNTGNCHLKFISYIYIGKQYLIGENFNTRTMCICVYTIALP